MTDVKGKGSKKIIRSPRWRKLRKQILEEDGNICGICNFPVDKSLPSHLPGSPEIDHIRSRRNGGDPFDRSNLQLAHKLCNQQKFTSAEPGYKKNRPLENVDKSNEYDWSS